MLASMMLIPDHSCDNLSVVEKPEVIPPVEATDWSPLATITHGDRSSLIVGERSGCAKEMKERDGKQ
ncbi:hypothetical protein BH23CHL5_BH23CHL5_02720 [soil metagenome]